MNTRELANLLIEKKGSSTAIGGAIGVLIVYMAWSRGYLNEPNSLVWGATFILFSALAGVLVDTYQYTKQEITNETEG